MLNFFRKYQKIFFFVIATVTIISITFFGTYQNVDLFKDDVPNRDLVKGLDGKWIREQDVKGLAFLMDSQSGLGEGFLEKELFESGLADLIAEKYFANFKRDLETRLEKIKSYRPYAHPQAPFLNANSVWSLFVPEMTQTLSDLQTHADQATPETLKQLIKLYRLQKSFPPEMLQRVLFYQQNQYGMSQDDNLARADLSLFHFKSVDDWFGNQFSYLISELVINGAAYAEKKGHRVTKEEAFSELLQNLHKTVQSYQGKEEVTPMALRQMLTQQLLSVRLTESQGIELWRKAVLFKRLFDEAGASLFLDPLLQQEFNHFALEKATVDLFQMPQEFRLRDFHALLKYQVYLDAITPKSRTLELPQTFFSVEEIEKRAPELVQRAFGLELIHVRKEELIQDVSLKEAWDWQLEDKNWEILIKEFPSVCVGNGATRKDRFDLLEKCDSSMRLKIDRFAKGKIAESHPEWLEAAFQRQTPQKKLVGIRLEEESLPLEGIENVEIFLALLQDAPLKSESIDPYLALNAFSQDKENYYRIWVTEKPVQREVLTFKIANQEGILDRLLDKRLEGIYSEMKKKDPSLYEGKTLAEVRDQVGAKWLSDLIKLMDERYSAMKPAPSSLHFYAHYRFYHYLSEAHDHIVNHPGDLAYIHQGEESAFSSQWKIVKSSQEMKRHAKPQAFKMEPGTFSNIELGAQGDANFFQLIARKVEEGDVTTAVETHQELLAGEARKALMEQLLVQISQKNAIDLSYLIKDTYE